MKYKFKLNIEKLSEMGLLKQNKLLLLVTLLRVQIIIIIKINFRHVSCLIYCVFLNIWIKFKV